MWPTNHGDRTLNGAESLLIAAAIAVMLDSLDEQLNDDEDETAGNANFAEMQFGIAVFDSLSVSQQIATLHHVAKHLLTAAEAQPPISSAVDDATIAAIFSEVQDQVTIEIDIELMDRRGLRAGEAVELPPSRHWRSLVLDALRQVMNRQSQESGEDWDAGLLDGLPSLAAEVSYEAWESAIESLVSAILWDRDFELAEGFMDAEPASAQMRRKLLGIDDDYFVHAPLDPTASEVVRLLGQARSIVARRPR